MFFEIVCTLVEQTDTIKVIANNNFPSDKVYVLA